MIAKATEHKTALRLRGRGYSYAEIAKYVHVSKSTLSLWLCDVPLDEEHIKRLADKKVLGQQKGAYSRRQSRIKSEHTIIEIASKEIRTLTKENFWLIGVVAYWCEGAKQKANNVSQAVVFSNSDPFLIKLFRRWLIEVCKISPEDIKYILYIHDSSDVSVAIQYWSKHLGIPIPKFEKTVLKKHNLKTNRNNTGVNYYGLIRISVRKSTDLNRKIAGWVKGISVQI